MTKKLLISLILTCVLTFSVAYGTYAYFTSSASSTQNVFTSGNLTITGPGTMTTDLSVSNLAPGTVVGPKTVTVNNSGSLTFKYKISVAPHADNPLYNGNTPLQVSINNGAWTNIRELNVMLGTVEPNQAGTFTIAFKLPETADNTYQGVSADFTFLFDATQTENTIF